MPDAPQRSAVASSKEDFFSFDEHPNAMAEAPMSVETEVMSYFSSAPTMESLHKFPRIIKKNTPL